MYFVVIFSINSFAQDHKLTWPARILIVWRSWADYGPINKIAVLSWEGNEVFSFNPDEHGVGYEGAAVVTLNGSGEGWTLMRVEAKTSNGSEGYTNPIWMYMS